jgi:hypothetical protein
VKLKTLWVILALAPIHGSLFAQSRSDIRVPQINNTVVIDGCTNLPTPKYTCDINGLNKAITDGAGSAGVAAVIFIPDTTLCFAGCIGGVTQHLNLINNTLTIPSNTYIVGSGQATTFLDYTGTGCAVDFPAGTTASGLIGLTVEIDAGQPSAGICIEGDATHITLANSVYDVAVFNDLGIFGYVTNQRGIFFNPTPSGSSGAAFITQNAFDNVVIHGVYDPIVSNGAFQNKFDLRIEGLGANQTAISGCVADDLIDAIITDYGTTATNAVAFAPTCNNNRVNLSVNFLNAGSRMLSDTSGNNIISVLDRQAGGVGIVGADSDVTYCNPLAPKCTHYFRVLQQSPTTFTDLGTPANGQLLFCSDCSKTTPCASGGTGAFAKRLNGAWDCN